MSDALRPTEFVWNGVAGIARHERVEISFSAWPPALLPGRAVTFLLFIPATRQFEVIEGIARRDMTGPEKAAVFSWLKGLAAAGHGYFHQPINTPCSTTAKDST
jgi:hypothetical protein